MSAELTADMWVSEYLSPQDIYQHGITRVYVQRSTPFQEMLVVESGTYGKALVLDGKWQTCTGDEFLYHEPIVHLPCLCHGDPRRVLIAGGADGGALREALKWRNVEEACVADLDGDVIDACKTYLPEIHQGAFDDPRARVHVGDAWELIEQTAGHWDVIIADLTDPVPDGPAYKLFTQEFFQLARRALRAGGVFVNQAGSTSPPFAHLLAQVAKTSGSVFTNSKLIVANVPTYGSPWGFVIASDQPLPARPDPATVDAALAAAGVQPLRMLDGEAVLGLMQTPKHLRAMVTADTPLLTLENPPQFFGRGILR